jgi:L-lactate dehydrogenase complex protein LldG
MSENVTVNPGRERILTRIRQALKNHTEVPWAAPTPIFAPVTDLLARFQAECKANITECVIADNTTTAISCLEMLMAEIPAGEVFAEDSGTLRRMLNGVERRINWSSEGPPSEQCRATITLCHALVALTGSVLISSACGGRGASIVAPIHIVVARESQILPDLEAALDFVAAQNLAQDCSYVGLITGCSRTGDIEKQLVIGAHGPRRLVVLVERGA